MPRRRSSGSPSSRSSASRLFREATQALPFHCQKPGTHTAVGVDGTVYTYADGALDILAVSSRTSIIERAMRTWA